VVSVVYTNMQVLVSNVNTKVAELKTRPSSWRVTQSLHKLTTHNATNSNSARYHFTALNRLAPSKEYAIVTVPSDSLLSGSLPYFALRVDATYCAPSAWLP
jgi:hypothetical protein